MGFMEIAIAARNLGALVAHQQRFNLGCQVKPVGKRDMKRIVALRPGPSGNGGLQVWVNCTYSDYRDGLKAAWKEAWETAGHDVMKILKEPVELHIIDSNQEVDHVFPQSLAKENGYDWLWLNPIRKAPNNKWRAFLTNSPVQFFPEVFTLREAPEVLGKVLCQMPPARRVRI